jgi:4-hydroxybenzoate polyprenyltransferase
MESEARVTPDVTRGLADDLWAIFVHARWPVQSYVLLGFLYGSLIARSMFDMRVLTAFISWLLLCAGLTVFNSYYDKDEEPVGGMSNPPKVTPALLYGSLAMQAVAFVLAFFVGLTFFILALIVGAIYFLYSHKSFRWKSNGYRAVILNAILGSLTMVAAASISDQPPLLAVAIGVFTAAFFKASVYMMMQVHQVHEDTVRGDVSIAVMFGRSKTLKASCFFMLLSAIFGAASLYVALQSGLIAGLFLVYLLIMAYLLFRWERREGDPARDYATMRGLIYYSGYVGSVLCLLVYALFNLRGGVLF